MAKRGMSGQINMFDFFSGEGMDGDVEMVSLFPGDGSFEDISEGDVGLASGIQEIEDEPKKKPRKPIFEPEPKHVVEVKVRPEPKPVEEVTQEPVVETQPEEADVKIYKVGKKDGQASQDAVQQDVKEPVAKTKVVKRGATKDAGEAIMHKEVYDAKGRIVAQIAFYNYNKVCLQLPGEEMREYQFDSSKEAVDFYIGEIWKLGIED